MHTSRSGLTLVFALAAASMATAQNPAPAGPWLVQPATPLPSAAAAVPIAALELAQPAGLDPLAFATRTGDLTARIARHEWDVGARAAVLGPGIEPAFAYVRDAIGYEGYAGVLRGAAGTYTARAGNAVDRALLLARLLASKNVRTQFAFGTLGGPDQDRLWQRIFATATAPAPELAAGSGPTSGGKAFRRRLAARATRDFGVVRSALGERMPAVTAPTRDEVLAEMNPHVWVQAEVDGRWIDLDPSFADGQPGTPVTAAERTAAELPAEMFQRLGVRLVLEQLDGGKLVNSTVLEVSRTAVDLVDEQVFVVHAPGKPVPMAGLGAAMAGYVSWTPGLWLGGEFTWGTMFTIDETGGVAAADAGEKPRGRGLLDVQDALAPEVDSAAGVAGAAGSAPVFVAEWLEFEWSAPGGKKEVSRRVLAERGGAAWRATLPLDGTRLRQLQRDAEGPIAMRAMHNVWFSAGPHNLADYADAMHELALDALTLAAGEPLPEADDFGASVWPAALQNFAWMVWTDHAILPTLNATPGVRLYADRPRIAIFTTGPDVDGGAMVMTDLRRDDLRALAASPAQRDALADKKLWFALLQGALEHEGIATMLTAFGVDPTTVETTSSRLTEEGVFVLRPGGALPGTPAPDPESTARLALASATGAIVVAPLAGLGARGVWWEVAPGSGSVTAVTELGLHGGRGGIPDKNNPFKRGKSPQQNPYGGQKPNYTPEAAKEARDKARQANNARREAEAAKNYKNAKNNVAKSSRRGASEYTVLTQAILVGAGSAAYAAFFYHLATTMMTALEALNPE